MTCERELLPVSEAWRVDDWDFSPPGTTTAAAGYTEEGERIRCKTADLEITTELEIKMTLEKHWLSEQCFLLFHRSARQANELLLTRRCVSDGKRFCVCTTVIDYS